jgi:hypothetical protein
VEDGDRFAQYLCLFGHRMEAGSKLVEEAGGTIREIVRSVAQVIDIVSEFRRHPRSSGPAVSR